MVNPLTRCVQDYALPPFATMRPSDIAPALRAAIDEMTLDLNSIEDDLDDPDADLTWESVMDRLEIITDPLHRLWLVVVHLSEVMNSPELRAAKTVMEAEVLQMTTRCDQSLSLFRAMSSLRTSAAFGTYSVEQKACPLDTIYTYMIATLKGVNLTTHDRDRFNAMQLRRATLNTTFLNNVRDAIKTFAVVIDNRTELDGVPDSALALFANNAVAAGYDHATAANGPWKLSLETPVLSRVLEHCSNRALREKLYCANVAKASAPPFDNSIVIEEILHLRQETARLLGFESYAELSLTTKMAPSVAAVDDMIESLRSKCYDKSVAEVEQLAVFASTHGQAEPLAPWDLASARVQSEEYDFDEEELKQYFPLPRVLAGLFEWVKQLFGIQVEAADGDEETWHPDVLFFRMRDMDQPDTPVVAQFYLDLFTRPGEKDHGSWSQALACRSKVLRTEKFPVRVPVVCLVWNQTPPIEDAPVLLSFFEVEKMFNLFGYGLRTALTRAECTLASSIAGYEWDVMDVAGKFVSHFCHHRETINLISGHVKTGEPLPDSLFDKLVAAKEFMPATTMLRQLNFAAVDMALHHDFDPKEETIDEVQQRLAHRFFVIPPAIEDRFPCWLGQIFPGSYAAGYYSYRWSDMLASDAFVAFEEADSQEAWEATGRHFRDTMFALMGTDDPNRVFEKFRGRKPDPTALLKQYGLL
ncbi:Aste57867_18376 [Aphanomyces stellatus]|uniref:oligopeptidase A n=1 Tax=Aphanomyces stellatus TaxID=120398 RepID=A0A485LDN2_9STRA|nr:hypothetical protein As57867_018314 [Aphanomyces stellatus]VFT95112.1 Aste57867_18376 [Aphanomyces stellatus]